MKKIILSAAFLLPFAVFAQGGFTINGKVGTLNAPAKAYLNYRAGTLNVTDSADVVNGAFVFKGKVDAITSASIRVKHAAPAVVTDPKKRVPLDAIPLYLENKTITVKAADSIKFASISGSVVNADNAKLKAALKPVEEKIAMLMVEYNKYTPEQKNDEVFMKPFMDRYEATTKEMAPIYLKFANDNTNSYIGLTAFKNVIGYDIDPVTAEPAFNKFSADLRNSDFGKKIAEGIAGAKLTQLGLVTDFTQNDADGKPVKLSDFKGKYVLVDFWASWCGPCRQENPNVVAAFNKYKDKNFTVLGVSLDAPGQKEAWLKAVKDDNLTWTQVSDLQHWKNAVSTKYGVQAIPFNFLVDPTGKIIARNIRGEELQTKLTEILGKQSK